MDDISEEGDYYNYLFIEMFMLLLLCDAYWNWVQSWWIPMLLHAIVCILESSITIKCHCLFTTVMQLYNASFSYASLHSWLLCEWVI